MDDEQQPSHLPSKMTSNATGDDQMEAASKDRSKSVEQPVIGMEFSSMEEARSYYEAYAGQQGFWIKQRSSKKTCIPAVCAAVLCSRKHTFNDLF